MTLAGACDDMWGGVTHGLEEGVMLARCPVAAVILITTYCSEALAIWIPVPDFPEIVRDADICVQGTVTLARELRERVDQGADSFRCMAEFNVDYVYFGEPREKRITIYYGAGGIDESSYAPGEQYVLFLSELLPPLKGYESDARHLGVFPISRSGSIRTPDKLRNPPKSREPIEFLREVIFLRGPEITVRPAKKSFRCDEAISVKVALRNPSMREMKLGLPARLHSPYGFRAHFLTAHGMLLHSLGWPLAPEHEKAEPAVLPPGEPLTREITFAPCLHAEAKRAYRTLARVSLTYESRNISVAEGGWQGKAFSAPAPIEIVCRHPRLESALGDAGESYAFELMTGLQARKFASGEPVTLYTTVAHRTRPVDERRRVRPARSWSWGGAKPSGQQVAAMLDQLEVRRDGKLVDLSRPAPPAGRWVKEVVKMNCNEAAVSWKRTGFDVRLDRYFDLARPGRYTVRLVVPPEETGEKRPLASNVVEFTVVGSSDR